MSRRNRERPLSQFTPPEYLLTRLRPPAVVVMGSPAEVINLLAAKPDLKPTCFQMDHYQADRLRAELAERQLEATVVTLPDLWDLPADFQTALYMPARGGERELKIDLIEQSFHVLRPGGLFLVWSSHASDSFFTPQMKKVYNKVHLPPHDSRQPTTMLWSAREGERPQRRHEVTFQVKIGDGTSCRFLSRPGTFSYGRFDMGARAMCEVMEIESGDRVLDLGCGVGTNGVFASQQAGPGGHIAFVDSNSRAIALAKLNAESNGVPHFEAFATATVEGPKEDSFDVVIANPPYFANNTIAQLFIRRAKEMLTPQGRFYLVTKQPEALGDVVLEHFTDVDAVANRGYTIFRG